MRNALISTLLRRCNDVAVRCRNIADTRRRYSTKPELTSIRYKMQRGPYNTISSADIRFFDSLMGSNHIITDPDECESYNIDFARTVRGASRCVLKPKSTEEVSAILKYCNNRRLAVVPQSGNTGLVGGSNPVFDEIVISMKYMNKILKTNELAGVLTCEAGCVLQDLENHLATVGMMMPLDLGAKGSCLIGGCVSTNAGGLRLLRYGNLHGNILGVEAVKANGDVVDALNTLKKNNTGYHHLAKRELGEILSSCEMMDRLAMDVSINNLGMKNPLTSREDGHEFYMLIETSGSHLAHDEEKLSSFVEKAMDNDIIEDGTLTNEMAKVNNIWALRERISEGVLRDGYVFKYDISLPFTSFYKVIEVLRERIRDPRIIRISGYGHLGDGNIHVQVSIPEYYVDVAAQLEPFIFEYVSQCQGSISAEHGIGFKKTKYLHLSKTPSEIAMMHDLKKLMDPNSILNPYKIIMPVMAES